MIFGRYTGKTTSGLNYNLPYPIGSVQKLAVTDRNTTDIGFISRMDDRTGEQATFDLPEESPHADRRSEYRGREICRDLAESIRHILKITPSTSTIPTTR